MTSSEFPAADRPTEISRRGGAKLNSSDTTPEEQGATSSEDLAADRDEQRRRLSAITSGFEGDAARARALLRDPAPKVRSSSLAALARMRAFSSDELTFALRDPSPIVRRMLCELAPKVGVNQIAALLDDTDARVVEACAFALGELGDVSSVEWLIGVAHGHEDPLCREAAVAALGAIGDRRGRETLLSALDDVAPIRRRAVIALSRFDDGEAISALRARLQDRDWQVRQAAEDVLELNASEEP